jgi:hypothetical protein
MLIYLSFQFILLLIIHLCPYLRQFIFPPVSIWPVYQLISLLKSSIFWDITPCSPFNVNRRFGGTCRLHLQGPRISQGRNHYISLVYNVLCFSFYYKLYLLTLLVCLISVRVSPISLLAGLDGWVGSSRNLAAGHVWGCGAHAVCEVCSRGRRNRFAARSRIPLVWLTKPTHPSTDSFQCCCSFMAALLRLCENAALVYHQLRSSIICIPRQILQCSNQGTSDGRACSTHGENRSAYKVLVRKSEGKRPLGISKSRWEGDVKWISKKQDGRLWTVLIWLGVEFRDGLLWAR